MIEETLLVLLAFRSSLFFHLSFFRLSFIFFPFFLLLQHLLAWANPMSYSLSIVLCCRLHTQRHTHKHKLTFSFALILFCSFAHTHTQRSQRKWANVNCTAFPMLFHWAWEISIIAPSRTFIHLCACVPMCESACIYISKAIVIGIMMTMFQSRSTVFLL